MENENQEKFMMLLEDALFLQENTNLAEVNVLQGATELIRDATDLVQSNKSCFKPYEVILDARILAVSTKVVTDCIKGIDGNLFAFNESLFVESILDYICIEGMEKTVPDWRRLNALADGCCKKTISLDYMLGTFKAGEREAKKRKERVVRRADYKGPVVKPHNVVLGEKQEDGIEDSLQLVMKVLSILHRRNNNMPICYFKLVMNPESFGATVENIYHLSFLVKDGLVKLSLDEDGLPVISPKARREPPSGDAANKTRVEQQDTNQCIFSLSYQDWQDIIETFQITRAKIPWQADVNATRSQQQ